MKAITASLLMENVLAPSFKFKPKDRDDQKASGADIYIKGLKEPSTERSKQIIENDMVELKASILQDDVVQAAISAGACDTSLLISNSFLESYYNFLS